MASFRFKGEIPGSKSIFNRALIVQSYFPALELQGYAGCDDVRFMREGLQEIRERSRIDCGEGGTTFRFMAVRASRMRGVHTLEATRRLMQRPQSGLLNLLSQLHIQTQIKGNELFVRSDGWRISKRPLQIDTSESSQYASALLLNSWLLDVDLQFELVGSKVSESYFNLTLDFVKYLGMRIKRDGNRFLIPAGQRISILDYRVESDLSSAFTMAAAGALAGESVLENFPFESSQPDKVFQDILKKMGVELIQDEANLIVRSAPLKAVDWDLGQSPDLFPVLAVLCSWAVGVSKLYGAPHLALKESNRIQKVADLFEALGVSYEVLPDGMIIHGNPEQSLKKNITFNPDQDHRMVMAAMLMKLKGHGIAVEHPEAVNKSFPEFWNMIGIKP